MKALKEILALDKGPYGPWNLANWLSYVRLLSIVPCIVFSFNRTTEMFAITAAVLTALAATDFLDGIVAKKFGRDSRFGQALDPLCDKLGFGEVLAWMAVMQFVQPVIPLWMLLVVAFIELYIGFEGNVTFSETGNTGTNPQSKWGIAFRVAGVLLGMVAVQFDWTSNRAVTTLMVILIGAGVFLGLRGSHEYATRRAGQKPRSKR